MTPDDDLSGLSMEELFAMEAETQCATLSDGLVALEASPGSADLLAMLMRAAHSLKGAARIVGHDEAVKIAHAMESGFVLAQNHALTLTPVHIGLLLRGVDLLKKLASGLPGGADVPTFLQECAAATSSEPAPAEAPAPPMAEPTTTPERDAHLLRVDSSRLDRLLGFAGEGVVAARQLEDFRTGIQRAGGALREALAALPGAYTAPAEHAARVQECRETLADLQAALLDHHTALDGFSRRWNLQADRLYNEALACRMRPLADIMPALRRLVRDLSHELGKPAALEVIGEDTPVDREILDRLETALTQLLRNALDHGLESPAERAAAGKPEKGRLVIEARHVGGHLAMTVSDDGRGLDLDALRHRIAQRGLATAETVAAMSDAEVIDFLFLPGFSLRDTVTEISGRGVGLDVVQSLTRAVGGFVRARRRPGLGLAFELRLPISLSVLRSLLVTIAGEPYAFPLAHLERALKVSPAEIESAEGRQFFGVGEARVSLASASQILNLGETEPPRGDFRVLLLEHSGRRYGVIVDEFLGERDLVIQPLDPALGRVPGISSASLSTDGSPVLVADVNDFVAAMERLATDGRMRPVRSDAATAAARRRRILVVEDSLTVRELERKLLRDQGYDVEIAVDGMDGWTAARTGGFDLVLTDVDMPRLDGIELTRLIKADPRLRDLPVMIVSYKDRDEDRRRGLEVGADYYLPKGNFQDRTLINAVRDLIGEPE